MENWSEGVHAEKVCGFLPSLSRHRNELPSTRCAASGLFGGWVHLIGSYINYTAQKTRSLNRKKYLYCECTLGPTPPSDRTGGCHDCSRAPQGLHTRAYPPRPCPRLGSMHVLAPRTRLRVRASLRRVFTTATATSTPLRAPDIGVRGRVCGAKPQQRGMGQ